MSLHKLRFTHIPLHPSKYQYFVSRNSFSYVAFYTAPAFIGWLGLHEFAIRAKKKNSGVVGAHGIIGWEILGYIEDRMLFDLEEIGNFDSAIPFLGLSNGSYVTCYLIRNSYENDGLPVNIVYRPNCNYPDVYKPFDYRESQEKINRGDILL